MKGLLLKDVIILREQKMLLVLMLFISVMMMTENKGDISFVAGYVILLSTTIATSSISYDDAGKGTAFLFTMPCTRRMYVVEKYVYGVMLSLVGGALVLGIGCVASLMAKSTIHVSSYLATVAGCEFIGIVFMSVMLPLFLKYGQEKGRIVFIVMFFSIFGLLILINKTGITKNVDVNHFLENALSPGISWIVMIAVSAVLLVVSILVSMRVMEKREF
ncbi:ABC-2 transporter permease [Hespellia stercorisuis]|uniref:ABC-2 family transporter protein n=1 Tax=Hespellia stercorisuis DSM 15480 TaxID=1121950 RepID=A0A1M6JT83_9FIRM|nr:ABC-2 transporter permease [Hespellia stercorisuis]SHJ49937.1 ABC-2 family transporter protein [Hespellia stercorisuis DSM 15480]